MKAIIDSTVIVHLTNQQAKMRKIIGEKGITELYITRINYLELLAGASENAKISTRKVLREFPVLEPEKKALDIGNTLAMKYRVSSVHHKDFLIARIAIANKIPLLTENDRHFPYKEIKVLKYRISE